MSKLKTSSLAAVILGWLLINLFSCKAAIDQKSGDQAITDHNEQRSLYSKLLNLVGNTSQVAELNDSAVFLILPLESSCPSCRKKVIDSIVTHQNNLPRNHYLVLSASAGKKMIRSYFLEQHADLPEIPGHLFIDSTSKAFKLQLYEINPTIYYAFQGRVYLKNSVMPQTIKPDLRRYFSSAAFGEVHN